MKSHDWFATIVVLAGVLAVACGEGVFAQRDATGDRELAVERNEKLVEVLRDPDHPDNSDRQSTQRDSETIAPPLAVATVVSRFAAMDIVFEQPVEHVNVFIYGGGWMECFVESVGAFGRDQIFAGDGALGLSTATLGPDREPIDNPRIVRCVFDSDTGGTFERLTTR